VAQFLSEPKAARQRLLDIKARGSARIEHEMEAQFDHEQGMLQQKAAQLRGVGEAFLLADEEGLEIGALGMSRPSTRGTLGLPRFDDRPVEAGKEGAILGDQGIVRKQSSDGRLVKETRCRYHS
jgi:hypothetical protein